MTVQKGVHEGYATVSYFSFSLALFVCHEVVIGKCLLFNYIELSILFFFCILCVMCCDLHHLLTVALKIT